MQYLRQSTATQAVLIGPFIDDTDGKTAETGLTIANTDIRLSANGGNMFAKTSGGGTHDEIGYYTITLDATDTATVGKLQLAVHPAGALPVYHEFQVLDEGAYDALFATAATILTSADVGLMYESTIATLTAATQWDMTAAFATDSVGIGSLVTVVDQGNAANFHSTWITALAQATDRITVASDAPWTAAAGDTVRVYAQAHPQYFASAAISAATLATTDFVLAMTQLLARTDAAIATDRSTELGQINANEGSGAGAFTPTTDSNEAISVALAVTDAIVDSIQTDTTAIVADTNELQVDWVNGGRLDLLLDAIKVPTDKMVFTKANELDVNTKSINDAEVVGDGNATPWDGV